MVLIVGMILVLNSFAQEARIWTLKECVDVALENNLRIKRSVYNVETFRANMMQAKGAFCKF